MRKELLTAMSRAAYLTRGMKLAEATREIQEALAGGVAKNTPSSVGPDITPPSSSNCSKPFPIDPDAEIIYSGTQVENHSSDKPAADGTPQRIRRPLKEVLEILKTGRRSEGSTLPPSANPLKTTPRSVASRAIPNGAQFLCRSFTCTAGARDYRLYISSSGGKRPRGLVVMLHGCNQNPEDFALGTGMNAVAEANGLLVAYPAQTQSTNASSCWNWFRPGDQTRGIGEPAIIAGITGDLMSEFDLDRSRVFVAGLSAGGAMAVIMGETYPDLYAAVGVHSGLAYRSANDVVTAFSAMRGNFKTRPRIVVKPYSSVRTILFHGAADSTVHASNAELIVASITPSNAEVQTEEDLCLENRRVTRSIVTDRQGIRMVEYWLVEQAGHAWSGGDAAGSYTDPDGPDASLEMVRFFLA